MVAIKGRGGCLSRSAGRGSIGGSLGALALALALASPMRKHLPPAALGRNASEIPPYRSGG
jgi:hypothetical protein